MRALLQNTYYYPEVFGGAEVSVKKLAEELVRMGVDCTVLCTGRQDSDDVVNGVRVLRRRMRVVKRSCEDVELRFAQKQRSRVERLYNPRNACVLERVLDEVRPDVLHSNGLYDVTPVLWKVANRRGVAVLHTLRDYALVCPRSSLVTRAGDACSKPHASCKAYVAINRRLSSRVGVVTAPSAFTLRTVLGRGLFAGSDAKVIPNAVDVPEATSFEELYAQREGLPFTIVYLGTLSEKKGVLWLLDAFGRMTGNVRLRIAGKGELEDVVLRAARDDKRVSFEGFLDEGAMRAMLASSHVLVCPSLWEEPFGRVVLDAYRMGLAVVASRKGALPEVVIDGKTGELVDPLDASALASALARYASNEALLRDHSRAAFEAVRRYSVASQAHEFVLAYEGALGGAR